MTNQFKKMAIPLAASLLILIFLDIVSTTVLPLVGLGIYRIPFNILLILFMAFKLETVYLPFLIFIMQYVHSFFSIEGWEMGTIAGIIVCITITYFKDVVHFSSYGTSVVVTQLFQTLWLVIVMFLFYFKGVSSSFLIEKLWRFIPESITVSLMAPLFFLLLDKIWDISPKPTLKGSF